MSETETLKAISARVRRARYFLETGRADQSREALDSLVAILPEPDLRHIQAAAVGERTELPEGA